MDNDKKRPALSPAQSLLHALIETIDHSLQSSTYLRETKSLLDDLKRQLGWYERALLAFQDAGKKRGNYDEFDALCEKTLKTFQNAETRLIENIKGLCEGTTDAIPYALATYLNSEFRSLCNKDAPLAPKADREKDAPDGGGAARGERPGDSGGVALCPFRQFNFFYQDIGSSFAGIFASLTDAYQSELDVLTRCQKDKLGIPPSMPHTHALIGCQYAMADDVLYHSVLFHELGHYLFDFMRRDDYKGDLLQKVVERLPAERILGAYSEFLQNSDDNEKQGFVRSMQTRLHSLLLQWTNELFADAFAAALGGPQYSLAFHDLTGPRQELTTFTRLHPADLLRQRQQWLALKRSGWARDEEAVVGDATADADGEAKTEGELRFEAMARRALATLRHEGPLDKIDPKPEWQPDRGLVAVPKDILPVLASILDSISARIADDAKACVSDTDRRGSEFWQLGPDVLTMLENAVVPSTIVSGQGTLNGLVGKDAHGWLDPEEGDKDKAWVYHPQPCTVMNVARLLHQDGSERLLDRWPKDDAKRKVFQVHSRLSDWTQKAIADWLLFEEKSE